MSAEEVIHLQSNNHWRRLPNPEVASLSVAEKVAMISARMDDLLTERVAENRDAHILRTPEVTTSESGVLRMRAFVEDDFAHIGYNTKDHYFGMVAADETGRLYAERHYIKQEGQSSWVYQIDPTHPEESCAYVYKQGEQPTQVSIEDGGLDGLLYSLGRVRELPRADDYEQGTTEPFEFLHPALHGAPQHAGE